jgi:hypothetical protein
MWASIGPRLEELGPVGDLYIDFVRLGALVYLVDRTTVRNMAFERELKLTIPVSDPDRWNAETEALEELLHLLSADYWRLEFVRGRNPRKRQAAESHTSDLVLLFSGGADSLSGALVPKARGMTPLLVSHWDFSLVGGAQNRVASELTRLQGEDPLRVTVRLGRKKRQLGSGRRFRKEGSSRSRSLLFLSLGFAVASINRSDLWMAENGFASLNVPLTGERKAALSTRTTHPGFLAGLKAALGRIGMSVPLSNPFESLTKGEVFALVKDEIGPKEASRVLSASHSCAKPDRGSDFSGDDHCGLCFGCLVRRAAFLASDLPDETLYIEEELRGDPKREERWGDDWRATYESVRARVVRGVNEADILALGLPDDYDFDSALRVAKTGLQELDLVRIP